MSENLDRPRAFSVRVFLPGGDPDGVKIVEKSNWTGSGMVIPRSLYAETRDRSQLARAGIYILVGPDPASQFPRVYVGEGDPIGPRIDSHGRNKDFWTHVVVFTSKDQNLNKAHVQLLESRLIGLAVTAKRCIMDNGNIPQAPSLSEADEAEVEGFLADVLLCLPVLGYGFFEKLAQPPVAALEFVLSGRGADARGYESPNGFVVRAASLVSKSETPAIHNYMRELRSTLMANGVLYDRGTHYEMTQDYTFDSPSTAAGVVLGRSANGRTEWHAQDGRTLKSIQDEQEAQ